MTIPSNPQEIIIAMCAGEASGDLLGAHLIEALKKYYPNAKFVGIGGVRMQAEGFESLYDQEKLAVRGYLEVISNLPEIIHIRSGLVDELKNNLRPHIFIGIDSPDFNLPVAAKLKAAGIPTIHYVSPSVWAWKAERVHKIVKQVNRVLCLFPMEPPLYIAAGGKAEFVGHPLAQMLPMQMDKIALRERLKLDQDIPIFTILPGSRVSEIEYMAPVFFQAARLILKNLPNAQFLVPYPTAKIRELLQVYLSREPFKNLPIRLQAAKTDLAVGASDVVLVTSGTAALEVALCKRPMVISYKISAMTYALVKHKIQIRHVGLPNILLNEEVVPELLQDDATPENLAHAVLDWYKNPQKTEQLELAFVRLHKMLLKNTDELAAKAVLQEAGLIEVSELPNQNNDLENDLEEDEPQIVKKDNDIFAEVGVMRKDKTKTNHAIPSVNHTLIQESADSPSPFQEVGEFDRLPAPKKPSLLARLFGKKQAEESEAFSATPRLHSTQEENPIYNQNNTNENTDTMQRERFVLEVNDDLSDVPINPHTASPMPDAPKSKSNIFDKYRQPSESESENRAAGKNPASAKENIFSKYMNTENTQQGAETQRLSETRSGKPNIFDKYRQQAEQAAPTPANQGNQNNIFDKYRQQLAEEEAIAESLAHAVKEKEKEAETLKPLQAQAKPTRIEHAEVTQVVSVSPNQDGERPNIFARYRMKKIKKQEVKPVAPNSPNAVLAPTPPKPPKEPTIVAVPVAEDIEIPERDQYFNDEDFIVVTDPVTAKPSLLPRQHSEEHFQVTLPQNQQDAVHVSESISESIPEPITEAVSAPAVEEKASTSALKETIYSKLERSAPKQVSEPILPKSSMAYKYALLFQHDSGVELDTVEMMDEAQRQEYELAQAQIQKAHAEAERIAMAQRQATEELLLKQLEEQEAEFARQEAERLATEQALAEELAKQEAERIAAEQALAEELARQEAERIAAEQALAEELARQEAARIEAEQRALAEELARQEAERIAAEQRAIAEQLAQQEAERIAAELTRQNAVRIAAEQRAMTEQRAREEAARIVAEQRAIAEQLAQQEAERMAAEQALAAELARQEAERMAAEQKAIAEELARLEAERLEAEQKAIMEELARQEAERLAAEQALAEELARQEAERIEAEQKAIAEELARQEAERIEAEQKAIAEELARQEAERIEAEQKAIAEELARQEAERIEAEQKAIAEELARQEAERIEAEQKAIAEELARQEAERIEAEQKAIAEELARQEAKRIEAEQKAIAEELARQEAERIEAEQRAITEEIERKMAEQAHQPVETVEASEPVFQHSPRFKQRYPAKTGYTAANQKLFF